MSALASLEFRLNRRRWQGLSGAPTFGTCQRPSKSSASAGAFGSALGRFGRKSGAPRGLWGSASGAKWGRRGVRARARAKAKDFDLFDRNCWTKRFDPAYCPARQGATNTLARGEPGRGRRVSTTPTSPHGRNNNQGRNESEPRRFCPIRQAKARLAWSVQPRQTREILTHSDRPILGQFRDTSRVSA